MESKVAFPKPAMMYSCYSNFLEWEYPYFALFCILVFWQTSIYLFIFYYLFSVLDGH